MHARGSWHHGQVLLVDDVLVLKVDTSVEVVVEEQPSKDLDFILGHASPMFSTFWSL